MFTLIPVGLNIKSLIYTNACYHDIVIRGYLVKKPLSVRNQKKERNRFLFIKQWDNWCNKIFPVSEPNNTITLASLKFQGDYLAIALNAGRVEVSYNLGKQALDDLHVITSDNTVNDNEWHTILFVRYITFTIFKFVSQY